MDLSKNNSQNIYNNEVKNEDYAKTNHNTFEEKNVTPSGPEFSSIEELCTRKIPANVVSNKSLIKSCEESSAQQQREEGSENLAGPKKDKLDVGDEVETIEKIAEMIAVSTKDAAGNSPKIKKRLKVLMSRTHSLNVFNNSDDSTSNTCVGISNTPQSNGEEDRDQNKAKSDIDQPNKKRKTLPDSPICQANEMLEEPNMKKSPFEEIEDKLQEMFAGIEDEELTNSTEEKVVTKKCNESILSIEAKEKECSIESLKVYNSPTSAKSSISNNPVKKNESKDNASPVSIKTAAFMKSMPPQRRLSIGMRKDFLKLSSDELYKKKSPDNEDKSKEGFKHDTQNSSSKQVKRNFSSNKSNNKQNKSCKYKKDINFDKAQTSNSKKIIRKCEAFNKSRQNRQKTKEPRAQRLQSSENDAEEKLLQPKDVETKIRSPYVLVKSNGTISVVNTIAPDELNEKLARPKKPYNYAHERKNVKGCYSSTLGNRYDADTADSSWKCVFCKLGPHKKRLGDLFGPYVISSDCEEYRSIKNSFEMYKRNEAHTLNIPKVAHKFNNITSNSHKIVNESKYEDFNTIHTAGMAQVSVNCYEVWVHEDCAIWAPNIFFVGSRLSGLEEASWKSSRYECVNCLKTGALLCCLQRGCKTTSHVPCAREFKWLLDESRFWVYCNNHAINNALKKN